MANPFEKRATEYFRDDEAFLSVVTPEPLTTFFQKPAEEDRLYDRLVVVIGTPGSGKTTLARLFQFSTLTTLLDNSDITNRKPLIHALTACRAITDDSPVLMGGRLPLESEYRDFWEFPYPEDLKMGLMIALLQARSVLAWLRNSQAREVPIEKVKIIPRVDANAALHAIGGEAGPEVLERARKVELAIYRISAALIPPDVEDIDRDAISAYRPFDVIEAFQIPDGHGVRKLRPFVVFDDAHRLHPDQFRVFLHWLARRELKVSRWILMRLDALTPHDVLLNPVTDDKSGFQGSRETTVIRMQNHQERPRNRQVFRKMAKDMAERYLRQWDVFNRRGLYNLRDLLSTAPAPLRAGERRQLGEHVDALQHRYGVSTERRRGIEQQISDYLDTAEENSEDLELGILSVLLERYAKRIPQRSLFEDASEDVEPSRALKVDAGVADGARIHLLHKYERPYFFGVDTLCDASSENAEQFLQLAAELVSRLETKLIRGKKATLTCNDQHKLLRKRAAKMVHEWSFPQCHLVRRLADGIARECVSRSLEGNASLGGGATAFGILQEEFDKIPAKHKDLARVLQFGVAYNAFVLAPNHITKGRIWCLIELGGVLLLHYGLTLRRGGFLERRTDDLLRLLRED